MAKRIKWGVIGAGGIAFRRTIPEGLMKASNAQLVAVMDAVKPTAEKAGGEFGVPWYADEDALLVHPGVEAVYIATPAQYHYRQAMKCLKAGKHILVEKPMALKVDECKKILVFARSKKLRIGVDFMMRFNTLNGKIREMTARGDLGKPVMARAQLSCWYPSIPGAWRQNAAKGGGGSLIDMGCHCIDLLEYIMGSRVREVSCFTGRVVQAYPVEDTAVMTVRFANGAIGIVDACFSIPDNSSQNILEIYGSKGSIIAKGTIGQGPGGEATAYLETAAKGYDARQARTTSKTQTITAAPFNTYRAQVESFSAAILAKTEPPIPGGDGLWNQKLMLAAYESARRKKVIAVK